MINAEVTAENRPACDLGQYSLVRETCQTHEYQRRVQVFVISLHEFLVIFLGHLAVIFVEPSAEFVLGGRGVLLYTARGSR